MTVKMGLDGKLYVAAELHEDLPTPISYLEVDLVEDIQHEFAAEEGTVNNRQSRFTKYGAGQIAKAYTVVVTYDPADSTFDVLYNALLAKTTIGVAVMDGDITTSGMKGWLMDAQVLSGPKPEQLSEFDKVTFTIKPSAYSTYNPTRTTIA